MTNSNITIGQIILFSSIFCSSCQLLLVKVFKLKTNMALFLLDYCQFTLKIHVDSYHNKVAVFLQRGIIRIHQLRVQHWQMQNKANVSTGELLVRAEDLPDGWMKTQQRLKESKGFHTSCIPGHRYGQYVVSSSFQLLIKLSPGVRLHDILDHLEN